MRYRNWAPVWDTVRTFLIEASYNFGIPYGLVVIQFAGFALHTFRKTLADTSVDGCVAKINSTLYAVNYSDDLQMPTINGFERFLNEECNTTNYINPPGFFTHTRYLPITPQYHSPYTVPYLLLPAACIATYALYFKFLKNYFNVGGNYIKLSNVRITRELSTLKSALEALEEENVKDSTLEAVIKEVSQLEKRHESSWFHFCMSVLAPFVLMLFILFYEKIFSANQLIPTEAYLDYLATQFCNMMLLETALAEGGTALVEDNAYLDAQDQFAGYDYNCTTMISLGSPNYPSRQLDDYPPSTGIDFGTILIQSWMSLFWASSAALLLMLVLIPIIKLHKSLWSPHGCSEEKPSLQEINELLHAAVNESSDDRLKCVANPKRAFVDIRPDETIHITPTGDSYLTNIPLSENSDHRVHPLAAFFHGLSKNTIHVEGMEAIAIDEGSSLLAEVPAATDYHSINQSMS